MDITRENLEGNHRESLRWFVAALIARLCWMTAAGVGLLGGLFQYAGWATPAPSWGLILGFYWIWLFPWAPSLLLTIALNKLDSRLPVPAIQRWTKPGLHLASWGMFCGFGVFLGLCLIISQFAFILLGLGIGLILETLAAIFFCRAEMALLAATVPAKEGEEINPQGRVNDWKQAYWIFRGNLWLQATCVGLFALIPLGIFGLGQIWPKIDRIWPFFAGLNLVFLAASIFWYVHFCPWIVVFCLRSLRTLPASGQEEDLAAGGETNAGKGGETKQAGRPVRERRFVPGLVLVSSMVVAAGLLAGVTWDGLFGPKRKGSVDQLKATVMIPALDEVLPEGKTVIWCATFQEAWRRLGKDVNGEAVQLEGMPEVSAELGRWNPDDQMWQGTQMVAEAGTPADGVYQRIAEQMEKIDPKIPTPDGSAGGPGEVAVAFGYLLARLSFQETYLDRVVDFPTGVPGQTRRVKAFGMPRGVPDNWKPGDVSDPLSKLRSQCVLLYESGPLGRDKKAEFNPSTEFCLDLDGNSKEVQVLVARVAKPKSLREGWETLVANMEDYKKRAGPEIQTIREEDSVAIPAMHWDLTARFLKDHPKISNGKLANYRIGEATQQIWFSLDKGGAEVRSMGKLSGLTALPRDCTCDRPFLVVMKNRKSSVPFLMVWVDNAEVLEGAGFWP